MEGITPEQYCVQKHLKHPYMHKNPTSNDVFDSFLSDDSKQDAATTTAHNKKIPIVEIIEDALLIYQYNMGEYRWLCQSIQMS